MAIGAKHALFGDAPEVLVLGNEPKACRRFADIGIRPVDHLVDFQAELALQAVRDRNVLQPRLEIAFADFVGHAQNLRDPFRMDVDLGTCLFAASGEHISRSSSNWT
ncbi:MAG: hypothetical protein ACTS3R_19485 [Inquilinaceae bacterium]